MKKLITLTICILQLGCASLFAQFHDDFSDGDFLFYPEWRGDTSQFIVNEQQKLQLNAEQEGTAYLSAVPSVTGYELEWNFDIRLSFAPSSSNFARIYLSADSIENSEQQRKGVFLQFGEAGNEDVIELFLQTEEGKYSVFRGTTSIASSFDLRIKVTKDRHNLWTLYTGTQIPGQYAEEGSAYLAYTPQIDNELVVYCSFTNSNRNKFYFDNFYVGVPIIDSSPPQITEVFITKDAPDQLLVTFSEPVSEESALTAANYSVAEMDISPAQCEFASDNQQQIRLHFAMPFEERLAYHLRTTDVTDISGNPIDTCFNEFQFYQIHRNEVIINEIMADPSPPIHLPEQEYIELHNTLDFSVCMHGWKLQLGRNVRPLPDIEISANGFALITTAAGKTALTEYCGCPIFEITSLGLTDDGMEVTLYDEYGNVVHCVGYERSWHDNVLKQDGGWSLEMMDRSNPCSGAGNWDSSISPSGGTPGEVNSIAQQNPDFVPPSITKVTVPDSSHLTVFFNEPLSLSRPKWNIDHNIEIDSTTFQTPKYEQAIIHLATPLRPNVIYTLEFVDSICDCTGNSMLPAQQFLFGLPVQDACQQLIINEVLSNPFEDTDGDFIEIYNPSESIVDLENVLIGAGYGELPDNTISAIESGFQLFPKMHVAVCKNRELTISQYNPPYPGQIVENVNLPALPNDRGCIHLLDKSLRPIDRFLYDKEMHYSQLTSTDGVSLERIHFEDETQNAGNWTSASASCGWATPGHLNSQHSDVKPTDDVFQIVPEVFSPDGDGIDDYVEIFCTFPSDGCRASVWIYNSSGLIINQLANNQYCGMEERFRWDGQTADKRACCNGIYIVRMKYWNNNGKNEVQKKVVSLIRRL